MELLDTLRFKRNTRGYVEETCISVYSNWVRGIQYLVVHPHHNDDCELHHVERHGLYMINYTNVTAFMRLFIKSWVQDLEFEIPPNVKWFDYDTAYQLAWDAKEVDDPNVYRIVVRDKYWRVAHDQFTVGSINHAGNIPALRETCGSRQPCSMIMPKLQAQLVACHLSAITLESTWCETNRKLFADPHLVIQYTSKENTNGSWADESSWNDLETWQFIGHDWVLQFNDDFTETKVKHVL